MNKILIDTDIIIDIIRNQRKAVLFIDDAEKSNTLSVSEITNMELIVGWRNGNELGELKKVYAEI